MSAPDPTTRLVVGEPFDPAALTEEQAARVLATVRAMPDLSDSAKELYEHLFRQARGERPKRHHRWRARREH